MQRWCLRDALKGHKWLRPCDDEEVQAFLGVIMQTGSSGGFIKHPMHMSEDKAGNAQWLVVATVCHDMENNHEGKTNLNIS